MKEKSFYPASHKDLLLNCWREEKKKQHKRKQNNKRNTLGSNECFCLLKSSVSMSHAALEKTHSVPLPERETVTFHLHRHSSFFKASFSTELRNRRDEPLVWNPDTGT